MKIQNINNVKANNEGGPKPLTFSLNITIKNFCEKYFKKVLTSTNNLYILNKSVGNRGVAQFGSARGLGPWGRGFESLHLDQYMVGIAQLVRAPDCGSGGREFESHYPPQNNMTH